MRGDLFGNISNMCDVPKCKNTTIERVDIPDINAYVYLCNSHAKMVEKKIITQSDLKLIYNIKKMLN